MTQDATLTYRHRLPVRLMHWINVLSLTVLFMSGLHIFNAHPTLNWGASSYSDRPALLEIGAEEADDASDDDDDKPANKSAPAVRGVTTVFGHQFDTTGVLGARTRADGRTDTNAFPLWMTIPGSYSLADARNWHFFFAWLFVINGVAYLIYSFASGHVRRDLAPTANDMRHIGESIKDHLRLRHPTGDAATRYNVLQKLAYLVVIFILLPLIVLMGMAMSPGLDALLTGWVDLFGGRQSARTIHFVVAWLLVAFVVIHVVEVILSGLFNHMRSMITGYYRIPPDPVSQPLPQPGEPT
ncbi:MAG: cytochrome b/b6 domain-containing protein [Pseudomonadota bacterium]|nr:cytochrome b/b6 domain-containing protein [Pseudomonadota bacterium]